MKTTYMYKNIEEKEKAQRTFNLVAMHLLMQGERSYISNFLTCAYRGENGKRCGIGPLIPNNRYKPSIECNGVSSDRVLSAIGDQYYKDEFFLNDLQKIHDHENPEDWALALHRFAMRYELSDLVIDHAAHFLALNKVEQLSA